MLEKPPNNMQKQMNKKLILIVALALLAVFGLGLLVGAKFSPSKVAAPTASNQNCAGVSAPKLPEGMEVKTANGTVKKVSNGTITLQTNQGDPMATQGTNTLTIHTDSNTKIYQLVQKDQAQFQQEMADFQKKLTEQQATLKDQASSPVQSAPVIPPMMQEKKKSPSMISKKVNNSQSQPMKTFAAKLSSRPAKLTCKLLLKAQQPCQVKQPQFQLHQPCQPMQPQLQFRQPMEKLLFRQLQLPL